MMYRNDKVYYQQHRRPYKVVIRTLPPIIHPTPPPHNPIDDLTDKDGLDQAYSTDADLSTLNIHPLHIKNQGKQAKTIYIYIR